MKRQSKLASLAEAVVNTGVGLLIAFVAQWVICWVNGIKLTAHDNAIIVGWMTVISALRSYVIRRLWNSEFWKKIQLPEEKWIVFWTAALAMAIIYGANS